MLLAWSVIPPNTDETAPEDNWLQAAVAADPKRPALDTRAPTSPIAVLVKLLIIPLVLVKLPTALVIALTAPDDILLMLVNGLLSKLAMAVPDRADDTELGTERLAPMLAPSALTVCRPL